MEVEDDDRHADEAMEVDDEDEEWITEEDDTVAEKVRESFAEFRNCGYKQWKKKVNKLEEEILWKEQVREEALSKLRNRRRGRNVTSSL